MGPWWATPNPWFGAPIELTGRQVGGRLDLPVIRETLARKGIAAKQPPPPFDEIEPAGAGWHRFLMHPGMLSEPLPDRTTGVAGEIVVDQVEISIRVRGVNRVEELLEPGRVAGGSGEGQCLTIAGTQGTVDPDLVRSTTVVQRSLDPVSIGRPARSRRKGARTYRSELVEAEDRRSFRWLSVEGDDPGSFGTNSGSLLSAQLRGWRHRIPSFTRIRRI